MKTLNQFFCAANLIAMGLYVRFVTSAYQLAVNEQRGVYDFGDSLNFFEIFTPIIAVNNIWIVVVASAIILKQGFRVAAIGLATAAVWALIFLLTKLMAQLPQAAEREHFYSPIASINNRANNKGCRSAEFKEA